MYQSAGNPAVNVFWANLNTATVTEIGEYICIASYTLAVVLIHISCFNENSLQVLMIFLTLYIIAMALAVTWSLS